MKSDAEGLPQGGLPDNFVFFRLFEPCWVSFAETMELRFDIDTK